MKFSNLASFQEGLKNPFNLCLVLAKEESDRKRALSEILRGKKEPPFTFSAENFSQLSFFHELETIPFLTKQKTILLENLEEIDSDVQKAILTYCQKPNAWICLIMTASKLSGQNKILKVIEKEGIVFCLEEEKPWDKEKRIQNWVVDELKKESIALDSNAALYLVQSVDSDELRSELEKLICFAGSKKKLTLQDVQLICHAQSHETIWQLGDAILQKNGKAALQVFDHLLENEAEVFFILAGLRSQLETAYHALVFFKESGKQAVTKAFPYLTGGLLEKKLKLFEEYGLSRLKQALCLLFEAEIRMKSSQEIRLIFEILITKLTHDSLSSSQCVGARFRP